VIELQQELDTQIEADADADTEVLYVADPNVSCGLTETTKKSLVTVGTKSKKRVRFMQIKSGDFGASNYKSDWTRE
jgi:hypothetical protein